ncbi:hypothetical protein [Alkalibacillus aidingensis]|uniref:hypothetical protein n=1 Tax=Alkalibacillus aidingensis TaxID=2747607 RepID=UPI00166100EE|nr:hypothetical protein [Alkalibacillus aidingensis]
MLAETFNHTIKEYGKDIYLNDESEPRKVLLSKNNRNKDFDEYIIHTNFSIQRGDMITWENEKFIIISDVQLKSNYEYKATIRP